MEKQEKDGGGAAGRGKMGRLKEESDRANKGGKTITSHGGNL